MRTRASLSPIVSLRRVLSLGLLAGGGALLFAPFPTAEGAGRAAAIEQGPQAPSQATEAVSQPDSREVSAETSATPSRQRPALGSGPVMRIPIDGVIEMGVAPFVERSLREAAAMEASAVILDIETPGGRVDAAERIVDAVSDSEVPVFAYVNRRAISAGAMISLSASEIFIRTQGTMGASTPVDGTGEKAPEKIVSVMRSSMRALAEARGLDPLIAEAMVDEELAVPGVVEAGQLLTLTYSRAEELGYATVVADWNALMTELGLEGREVVEQRVNWAERTVRFLSNPLVAPFLLSLGFLGLIVEVKTPGFGVAGAAGALSLALFFGSHLIVGLAGAEGVLLFGAGVLLLLVEVFLLPGLGVFGILGAIAILAGIYMSLLGGIPVADDFARASMVLAATLGMVLASTWMLVRRMPANRRLTRLGIFLGESTDRETGYTSAIRRTDLKGAVGTAVTDLRPAGTGLFGDERVDVVADSEWIEAGSPIRILSSEGYRHVVRRAEPDSPAMEPTREPATPADT